MSQDDKRRRSLNKTPCKRGVTVQSCDSGYRKATAHVILPGPLWVRTVRTCPEGEAQGESDRETDRKTDGGTRPEGCAFLRRHSTWPCRARNGQGQPFVPGAVHPAWAE